MANCSNCKNSYVEDIWFSWDCHKATLKRDEEGFPSKEEFDCEYYEIDKEYHYD